MSLQAIWFTAIAILWTGFFVLEGFDFGVGMVSRLIGRTDAERRTLLHTIGPFWDGNEVWLIVAGAAIFAAFPAWYATMFSGMYLALVLLLVALILRGVSFEFRDKVESPRWRRTWDIAGGAGSLVAPFLVGVALANLVGGLPIDADQEYTGTFFDLLNPYALAGGITVVLLCLLHGSTFLILKTGGELRTRVQRFALRISLPAMAAAVVFGGWTHYEANKGIVPGVVALTAVGLVIAVSVLLRHHADGWAFVVTTIAMAATIGAIFNDLYPRVMVSSTSSAYDLTVTNTASGHYTLAVMTVVAVILLPAVICYQGWTYWVFHARVQHTDAVEN